MRYPIPTFFCLILSSTALADSCPTVNDLQSGKALHWKAFDSDSGKPLATNRETRLKQEIRYFALAEWAHTKSKGSMHCYYKNESGSHLEAYFAKDSVTPMQPSKYWYQVTGMMHCAAGADKCAFQALPEMRQQLAQNDIGN